MVGLIQADDLYYAIAAIAIFVLGYLAGHLDLRKDKQRRNGHR